MTPRFPIKAALVGLLTCSFFWVVPQKSDGQTLLFEDLFKGATLNSQVWNPYMCGRPDGWPWNMQAGQPQPSSSTGAATLDQADYDLPSSISTGNGLLLKDQLGSTASGYTWTGSVICSYPTTNTFNGVTTKTPGFLFTDAYFEVRVKMPFAGNGAWPAIWFLHGPGTTDTNAGTGEIDLHEGGIPSGINNPDTTMTSSLHSGIGFSQVIKTGVSLSADYHVYGMDYRQGQYLRMYFDGGLVVTFTNSVPTGDYFIILVNAMANGNAAGWHSQTNASTPSPDNMQVAYVRVYSGMSLTNLTSTSSQALGSDWTAALWQTNGVGTAVTAAAGGNYRLTANGNDITSAANNTRLRTPTTGPTTFPGDSLTVNADAELRLQVDGGNHLFPGVDGNPGLILNGGFVQARQGAIYGVGGIIKVAERSYFSTGNNSIAGGANVSPTPEGFNIFGQLTGSGDIVITQGNQTNPSNSVTTISCSSNLFSGQWIVKSGFLKATGTNSLGTNNIIVDPNYPLVLPFTPVSGPSWLDIGYDIYSVGTLTLANGGKMFLHQNCTFGGVTVEGTSLTNGTYTYAQLTNSPYHFTNFMAGGSGSITVLSLPPNHITLSIAEGLGLDWNSVGNWSDGNAASVSAAAYPGSTYEVLPGGLLRTPQITNAVFPGVELKISGDGNYIVGGGPNIGELRLKISQGAGGVVDGTLSFPSLVMNGGQMDVSSDGINVLEGNISVLTNSVIYNDANDGSRSLRIDSVLSGGGTFEYHGYPSATYLAAFLNSLNITGNNNTFSGAWNVVAGTLIGTGTNSLGTNNITVGAAGSVETTYDINSPQATLTVDGRVFLHQDDQFQQVIVGGVSLAPGLYTFAQLNSAYPANFPAAWNQHDGSVAIAGSGSIQVGNALVPVPLQFQFTNSALVLNWPYGTLLEATNVTGPWTTNVAPAGVPYMVTPDQPQKFYRVQVQ